ncbi:MAG: hypothetical protein AB9834_08900 [Lentimicrobium sp.]
MRSVNPVSIRLLIFGLGSIFIFASCSKEVNNNRALRLKTLAIADEYKMPAYTVSSAINYHYNDKKQQVAISSDGNQDSISISYGIDGRISGMIIFNSGVKSHDLRAEWTNNQLILYRRENENSRLIYYFNDENLVEKVEGVYLDNNVWITFRYDEYHWENGNPVYFESYLLSSKSDNHLRLTDEPHKSILRELTDFSADAYKGGSKGATLKKEFSSRLVFDGMNSPYSDSPVYRVLIFEAWALFSRNNPVQMIIEHYNSAGTVYKTNTYDYIYEYNGFSLPVKRTTISEENLTQNASYYYE